jgi:ribonuclease VapC
MTLDTSALIAVLFSEPGYLDLVDQMLEADVLRVGAPTLAEVSLVFESRRGRSGQALRTPQPPAGVRELLDELGITVIPFGDTEWQRAAEAFLRFGRGRHKAGLNFGDCLAYATAKTAGDSLLYVGDDFALTDAAASRR